MRRVFIAKAAHELRTPLDEPAGRSRGPARRRDRRRPGDLRVALTRPSDSSGCRARSMRSPRATPRRARRPSSTLDLAAADPFRGGPRAPGDRAGRARGSDRGARRPAGAGRPRPLAQVLANLLSNAVRYTPTGGSHGPCRATAVGSPRVGGRTPAKAIPPEDLDRVFERFYRVEKSRDRARGGAGHRSRHRQAARRGGRRPGRRRVHATGGPGSGSACRPDPRRHGRPTAAIPRADAREPEPLARPEPLAAGSAIADDDRSPPARMRLASPTSHAGGISSPNVNDERPATSRTPARPARQRLHPAGLASLRPMSRHSAVTPSAGMRTTRTKTTTVAAFATARA